MEERDHQPSEQLKCWKCPGVYNFGNNMQSAAMVIFLGESFLMDEEENLKCLNIRILNVRQTSYMYLDIKFLVSINPNLASMIVI